MLTLNVRAGSDSAVAYQTVYSDGKSGAKAPFGAGYGGNDSGKVNSQGRYQSTFTVSPKAPTGKARVDVYVNDPAAGWGFTSVKFEVGATGGC